MNKVKTTAKHSIYQKRSGRYAVKDRQKRWVRGDDKLAVLNAEGLIKASAPKPEPAPEAEEAEATPDQQADTGADSQ